MPVAIEGTVLTVPGSQEAFRQETAGNIAAAYAGRGRFRGAEIEIDDTSGKPFVFNSSGHGTPPKRPFHLMASYL